MECSLSKYVGNAKLVVMVNMLEARAPIQR